MPRASGSFTPPSSSWSPATFGNAAAFGDWNALLADLSSALTQSISQDGQTNPTANLPMSGFKHTGAGSATGSGQYITWGQACTLGAVTLGAITGTAATFTTLNGGQFAGLRNRVINGDMQIAQRGNVAAVNGTFTYGGPDRFCTSVNNLSSGTIQQIVGGVSSGVSGFSHAVQCTTAGAGSVLHQTRIEAANVKDLTGSVVTITCKLYQDTGSTQTYALTLLKPTTTADTHSPQTTLQTSGGYLVPTDTLTTVTWTTSAVSDASLGLAIGATVSIGSAVTSKYFAITDVQLEKGPIATPFERRPIGMELALCQRYFFAGRVFIGSSVGYLALPVQMRAAMSVATITGGGAGFSVADGSSTAGIICSQAVGSGQTITVSTEL